VSFDDRSRGIVWSFSFLSYSTAIEEDHGDRLTGTAGGARTACWPVTGVAAAVVAGDDKRAAALLRGALEQWHGPALAGVDSPWLGRTVECLELQRVAVVIDLGDIALRQRSAWCADQRYGQRSRDRHGG
jgi:Bacterial transcriptional activator domain